jgi:hypothetical protein
MVVSLVCLTKPLIAFDFHGNIKPFGIGDGKTVFSLGTIVSGLSIVCFYVFILVDMLA